MSVLVYFDGVWFGVLDGLGLHISHLASPGTRRGLAAYPGAPIQSSSPAPAPHLAEFNYCPARPPPARPHQPPDNLLDRLGNRADRHTK